MRVYRRCGWAVALAGVLALAPAQAAPPDAASAREVIRDWPKPSQGAAEAMLDKYGPPQEATATALTWQGNGAWVRTTVHKTPVEHDFPEKHVDVLEQVVEYRVPINFYEALAKFDGSVVPDRTRGELTVHCDSEATNILALNLARDIIRGEKTPEQARTAMADAMRAVHAGKVPDDARELRLGPPQGDMRDPDTAIVTAAPGGTAPAR